MDRRELALRPWEPGDQDAFVLRADFAADRAMVDWDWSRGAPGLTWSVVRGRREVIGVGGVIAHQASPWEAWAWLAEMPRRDWPTLLRMARGVLHRVEVVWGARIIEAGAHADNPAAIRCLRKLGFSPVEPLREAGSLVCQMMERRA